MRLNRFSYNSLMFVHRFLSQCRHTDTESHQAFTVAEWWKWNWRYMERNAFALARIRIIQYFWGHFNTLIAVGKFCTFAPENDKNQPTESIVLQSAPHKVDSHSFTMVRVPGLLALPQQWNKLLNRKCENEKNFGPNALRWRQTLVFQLRSDYSNSKP